MTSCVISVKGNSSVKMRVYCALYPNENESQRGCSRVLLMCTLMIKRWREKASQILPQNETCSAGTK